MDRKGLLGNKFGRPPLPPSARPSSQSVRPGGPPGPGGPGPSTTTMMPSRTYRDFSPLRWSKYFSRKVEVTVGDDHDEFIVYQLGHETDEGYPAIVFLHGAGFSGLTWARASVELYSQVKCQIFAIDLRGHGETQTRDDDNLSSEKVSNDIISIIKNLDLDQVPVIIVGHSFGGAMGVHTALENAAVGDTGITVAALVVIDVVEGTALESLSSMNRVLRGRPRTFETITEAVEWSVRSGQSKDLDSARVSMPGQLMCRETGEPATLHPSMDNLEQIIEISPSNPSISTTLSIDLSTDESKSSKSSKSSSSSSKSFGQKSSNSDGKIDEENEEEEEEENEDKNELSPSAPDSIFATPSSADENQKGFGWRIDLAKTEPHWVGWFKSLSSKFLAVSCPKLLILAGVERLDKDLMIGQMQGKFQMQVIPHVGHIVQEDDPEKVAQIICQFLVRQKLLVEKEQK